MGAGIPLIQDQDRLEAVWAQVLERLRGLLNGATYSLTFERARALGFDGGRFRIGVETEFARGWIVQRYDSLVRDALFEVLGQDVVVAMVHHPPDVLGLHLGQRLEHLAPNGIATSPIVSPPG